MADAIFTSGQRVGWKGAVKAPTTEEINVKVAARLKFFEDELRKRGFYLKVGAEQKFFMLNDKYQPWFRDRIEDSRKLATEIENQLKYAGHVPFLEKIELQEIANGKYQATFVTPSSYASSFSPSNEIARQILKAREDISLYFNDPHATPPRLVSFKPAEDVSISRFVPADASAGLHLNLSLENAEGKNLFFGGNRRATVDYSALLKSCAARLLTFQQEGLPLYIAGDSSYKRFGRNSTATRKYGISTQKNDLSICLRPNFDDDCIIDNGVLYRLEDRLPGADTNPYFGLLADVGAAYEAVVVPQEQRETGVIPEPIIYKQGSDINLAHTQAIQRFENSALWKEIAGEDLHKDLVTYFKAQTLKRTATEQAK